MKIGELDMHCGNCKIIDHCAESFSDICICSESRFEDVEEDLFIKLIKKSTKKSKQARINDVFNRLKIKNILWKYDNELGVAYFCPNCKSFLCSGKGPCISCGQTIDWKHSTRYKGRVKWN